MGGVSSVISDNVRCLHSEENDNDTLDKILVFISIFGACDMYDRLHIIGDSSHVLKLFLGIVEK